MKIILLIWGYFFPYKTKKERKEIYAQMARVLGTKHQIPPYPEITFCGAMQRILPKDHGWVGRLWKFPELYWYRPLLKSTYDIWWEVTTKGIQKRIDIVNKISI